MTQAQIPGLEAKHNCKFVTATEELQGLKEVYGT
jgi:hypothetical protein